MTEVLPIKNEAGEIFSVMIRWQDVTEQKQTEEVLRNTTNLQNAILNSANYSVISTSPDGLIKTFNRTAEKWLGYSADEIVDKQSAAIFHDSQEVIQRTAELNAELGINFEPGFETFVAKTRSGSIDEREWTYIRKDGSRFPVLLSITSMRDNSGEITGFLGVATDITERKQMERELEATRDAALESARLKSEFLANMSHEIRTPMNGIIGMSELMLGTNLDAEQRDYAETVQASGTVLLTIINDILDFSKIEAGKLHFETVDFDVQYVLDSVIELFAANAEQKKLELASLLYGNVPTALRGDPGRLRQILTNLIGNAIKFTEKGEIVVRIKSISETATNATLHFSVTDTGIGIGEEARRNLFRAFVQADGSITRRYGGTGLGLAISKQLTAMMNGEMDVESEVGKGSTFWFTSTFEKQPADRKKAIPRSDLSGLRVLIVDDNETNRKILTTQTASWQMKSTSVESGKTALTELRAAAHAGTPYDIAIIDLMMPEMDGFALAEQIKQDSLIKDIRLLLMPSYGMRGHSQMAKNIGIDAYVIKPISQSELYNCLTDIFASSQEIQPEAIEIKSVQPKKLVTRHTIHENDRRKNSKFLILVAEDNLVNQKVISRQIENLGFNADIVTNGQEALDAYSSGKYSLIFMDCQMPVKDGYTATSEIRQRENDDSKHIPIIALTASAIQGDREKCIAAGMDDYISKPTNQQAIGEIINRFLNIETDASA